MNGILQIGIGLLPAAIVLWVILFKRKAGGFKNVICSLGVTAACLGTVVGGAAFGLGNNETEQMMTKEDMLSFANALVEEGGNDSALEVIDEYSEEYGYDDECSLLTARVLAAEGDYVRANGIYNRLLANDDFAERIKTEAQLVNTRCAQDNIDTNLADYLAEIGEDAASYGIETVAESERVSDESILEAVLAGIEKDNKNASESIIDAAAYAVKAAEYYESYFDENSEVNDDDVEKLVRRMNSAAEEENSLFSLDVMRLARLKMLVLSGEYGEIAADLNDNASYDELMIAAELYVSDKIDEKDFAENYSGIDDNDAKKILDKVKKVSEKISDDMTKIEERNLDERVEAIENQLDAPSLSKVKTELEQKAETEAGTDKSKVYLSVAKIDNYFGNEKSSESNMNKAIYNSPDCEDSNYTVPMSQIIGIIDNDGETATDEIKKVSEYVEQVLDNSTTLGSLEFTQNDSSVNNDNSGDYDNFENSDDFTGQNSENENSENEVKKPFGEQFADSLTDYVSKVKSIISIGKINTDEFEKVTAQVQIASEFADTPEELKKILTVYDCGVKIDDYTIEKLSFDSSNIMLICDVSGSMSDNMEFLKSAVSQFVSDKTEDENIAIVKFDSSITGEADFTSTEEQLQNFIANMSAGGGTAIFDTTHSKLNDFNDSGNTNDIFIVMTDGQDGSYASDEMIAELGGLARSKGVTLYTLGLGESVDTDYLIKIADAGNGDFVYVSDAASLEKFYEMLHEQLANQYLITYNAVDTLTSQGRTLEVAIREENIKDVKNYNLNTNSEVNQTLPNVGISGLGTRFIIKGNANTDTFLYGFGFTDEMNASLTLKGNISYDIELEYVSENSFSLTIPATIAVGVYDLHVTIDGKKVIIDNGLTVANPGDMKKLTFGPYVFTALEIAEQSEDYYLLRGNVTMNGWLKFKDELIISGDVKNGGSITVTDNYGSYITYDKTTAVGLAEFFAEYSISPDIPALGVFTLYNDSNTAEDYEDYMVDSITPGMMKVFNLVNIGNVSIKLYPDKITGEIIRASLNFPGLNAIFKAKSGVELLDFENEGKIIFTDKNVGLKIKYGAKDPSDFVNYISGTLMNQKASFALDSLEFEIDTIKNEYSGGLMVSLGWFDTSIGADIALKGGLLPKYIDSFTLHYDRDYTTTIAGVPVTLSDFAFGAEDIQKAVQNNNFFNIILKAGLSISACKISAICPPASEFLGDVSLFSLDEAEFKLRFSPLMMSAQCSLNFLGDIKIAETELELGTYEYTNLLLNIEKEEAIGFRAKITKGLMWEHEYCNLDISGSGELNLHSKFLGATMDGTASVDIDWWILSYETKEEGEISLGLQTLHNGDRQFILATRQIDSNGKVKKNVYTF